MAQQTAPRRRSRGDAAGKPALYARVDQRVMDFVRTTAEQLGISQAEFVDELMLHELSLLDERGLPPWWSKPLPSDEELGLRAS